MRNSKPLIFVTTEQGCFIPLTHKLNQDGYFRKRGTNGLEMFHRTMWKVKKGEIPDGYEINHLCGCRACANVEHMECITGTEHAIKTNLERYAHLKDEAKKTWKEGKGEATKLVRKYGHRAYKWVRDWKAEAI